MQHTPHIPIEIWQNISTINDRNKEPGLEMFKSEAITLLKETGYWNDCLVYDRTDSLNRILFKGLKQYDCKICERPHIKNTNGSYVITTKNGIFYHCRGNIQRLDQIQGNCLLDDEEEGHPPITHLTGENKKKPRTQLKQKNLTKIDHSFVNKKLMMYDQEQEVYVPKDKKQLINYFNDYLISWDWTGKPAIIEINYNDHVHPYIIRTISQTVNAHLPIKKPLDYWLYSDHKKSISNPQWIPYTVYPPNSSECDFNLFFGFKHKVPTNLSPRQPTNKIQPILDLIKEVWCSRNETYYEYIISWFAHKLQKPQTRIKVAIVLKSIIQGAGKNTITDFFSQHVLGASYCRNITNIEDVLAKFNADSERSLITCLDETIQKGAAYKNHNRIKDLITRESQRIENKGLDLGSAGDYNDYIFTTNDDWIVKVEFSDRRFFCLEVDCKYAQNEEYFTNIRKHFCDESGKEMFEYLLTYNISQWKPSQIPITKWKRELKEKSIPPVIRCIINLIKHNKNSTESVWFISEFYDEYINIKDQFKKDITSNNLAKQIYLLMQTEGLRPIKNGSRRRGIKMTIQQMMDRIRSLIKDQQYSFDDDDDISNFVPLISKNISPDHLCLKGSNADFYDTDQIKQVKISIKLRSDQTITNYNQDKEKHTQASIILKEMTTPGEIKKRKGIPKRVRELVWKTYINTLESTCLVCGEKQITAFDFECGHVDAHGPTLVENLRPICRSCNSSMGRHHMKEFAETYFPRSKVLSTF